MRSLSTIVLALTVLAQSLPPAQSGEKLDDTAADVRALVVEDTTIKVPAGGNLQAALDAVKPGGTIALTAGATYTGNFVVHRNDFTLTTGGVTLTGRAQPADAVKLAHVISGNGGSILDVPPGTSGVTVRAVHFGPFSGNDAVLVGHSDASQTTRERQPRRIVIDQALIEGDQVLGAKRGIALHGSDVTVSRSSIWNFKRAGQDTQAICGWNGEGPFTITDNFLEAAGENIMFGGDNPTIQNVVPADIKIEGNTLSKPLAWRAEKWTVKNLLELKAGKRVTIRGNTLKDSWASGQGYAVMFTPVAFSRNPMHNLEDVSFVDNTISNVAGGISLLGNGQTSVTGRTVRVRIRGNHIATNKTELGGQGWPFYIGRSPADVVIEDNTVEMPGSRQFMEAPEGPVTGFRFVGNLIVPAGQYGLRAFAGGTTQNNGARWHEHFPDGVIEKNAFADAASALRKNLPNNTFVPSSEAVVVDGYGTGAVKAFGRRR